MIVMINERNGHKTKFKSYKKLYDHIDGWVFARHSYCRAMAFYDFVCTQKEKAKEDPGWENTRFDVLEMSYDKSVRPLIIPIMPNADIGPHWGSLRESAGIRVKVFSPFVKPREDYMLPSER